MTAFRAGYVALVGEANAGKSTLLNTLVGEKLSIVTPKPHTTRRRLVGVCNLPEAQLVFIDTPGFVTRKRQRSALTQLMQNEAGEGAAECDVLALVVDAANLTTHPDLNAAVAKLKEGTELRVGNTPDVVLLNKVDLITNHGVLPVIAAFEKVFNADPSLPRVDFLPISARKSAGTKEFLKHLVNKLPESEPIFAEDELTTASERFIAGEIVREKAMMHLREELPYALAVEVEVFEREGKLLRVGVKMLVEKNSQKGIVIGQGGSMLKRIGTEARLSMEEFFGCKVHLESVVAVEDAWSESPEGLKRVGVVQ